MPADCILVKRPLLEYPRHLILTETLCYFGRRLCSINMVHRAFPDRILEEGFLSLKRYLRQTNQAENASLASFSQHVIPTQKLAEHIVGEVRIQVQFTIVPVDWSFGL